MAKINVGDLVCMYRRKKKGMGIVLEHTPDIIMKADVGLTFDEFNNFLLKAGDSYDAKVAARRNLQRGAKYPELITTCMIYNASWAKKPKKEFVRIRWFERPSLYETGQITEEEEWCPADWVRRI
jgi:hypothetical protein